MRGWEVGRPVGGLRVIVRFGINEEGVESWDRNELATPR
jgi:hypothetical protein